MSSVEESPCALYKAAYYAGLLIFGKWFVQVTLFLWKQFRLFFLTRWFRKDLKKFGKWAVVTGASDGIGKALSQELARRGLNVALISRSEDKLQAVAKEIYKECPYIETKVIVHDFASKDADISEIQRETEDMDVGLLFNNVGMAYGKDSKYFSNADMARVTPLIDVNVNSLLSMTHMMLQGMIQKKKGVIVHVSSGTALCPMPFLNVYGATKAFVAYFARQMRIESASYPDIHHQLLLPHFVCTKMSNAKPGMFNPVPEEFVNSALNTIGLTGETTGYWAHEIQALFFSLPSSIITSFMIWSLKRKGSRKQKKVE